MTPKEIAITILQASYDIYPREEMKKTIERIKNTPEQSFNQEVFILLTQLIHNNEFFHMVEKEKIHL